MSNILALTTSDNPNDPVTEFDDWWEFDVKEKGYKTCEYIARIAATSDMLSDKENEEEIDRAIKEIAERNLISAETGGAVSYVILFDDDTE